MTREEKTVVIEDLKTAFINNRYFYIADCSALTADKTTALRRLCFEKGITLKVVKNKLIKKALQWAEEATGSKYSGLNESLHGFSAVLFSESSNAPAKLIKEFRESNDKPVLKGAYIDSDVFLGDENLDTLVSLKSKEDLLGDIITLLQSPMYNLLGALQSGGNTIGGLLKTLEERESA